MDVNAYLQKLINWCLSSGLHIGLILILTGIALKAAKVLSTRLISVVVRQKEDPEFQKRTQTLGSIVRYVLIIAIIIVGALTVLKELGVEIGPILAAAGIVGLAVGFGAQSLVKDVISGFFMLLEDQIRVGDVVQIAGKAGLVEKINLKTTILRDLAGNVHYVPNGQIDAYREDVDEVIEVIKEVDEELRNDPDYKDDILEPIEILGLDQFADSAVIVKARTTTVPIKQWRVGREFNRRLKKKFDERDIEIPFPHVTVYMGQGKQGQAPPLRMVKEGK